MLWGGFRKRGSYQEVQENEAELVARLRRMMRSAASRIVRWSSSSGRVCVGRGRLLELARKQ
jgi:hypothetical protein